MHQICVPPWLSRSQGFTTPCVLVLAHINSACCICTRKRSLGLSVYNGWKIAGGETGQSRPSGHALSHNGATPKVIALTGYIGSRTANTRRKTVDVNQGKSPNQSVVGHISAHVLAPIYPAKNSDDNFAATGSTLSTSPPVYPRNEMHQSICRWHFSLDPCVGRSTNDHASCLRRARHPPAAETPQGTSPPFPSFPSPHKTFNRDQPNTAHSGGVSWLFPQASKLSFTPP